MSGSRPHRRTSLCLYIHFYSAYKVAMYINKQINKQKSTCKQETITCNRPIHIATITLACVVSEVIIPVF